jgi:hypothetical protein
LFVYYVCAVRNKARYNNGDWVYHWMEVQVKEQVTSLNLVHNLLLPAVKEELTRKFNWQIEGELNVVKTLKDVEPIDFIKEYFDNLIIVSFSLLREE